MMPPSRLVVSKQANQRTNVPPRQPRKWTNERSYAPKYMKNIAWIRPKTVFARKCLDRLLAGLDWTHLTWPPPKNEFVRAVWQGFCLETWRKQPEISRIGQACVAGEKFQCFLWKTSFPVSRWDRKKCRGIFEPVWLGTPNEMAGCRGERAGQAESASKKVFGKNLAGIKIQEEKKCTQFRHLYRLRKERETLKCLKCLALLFHFL